MLKFTSLLTSLYDVIETRTNTNYGILIHFFQKTITQVVIHFIKSIKYFLAQLFVQQHCVNFDLSEIYLYNVNHVTIKKPAKTRVVRVPIMP